MMDPKQLSEINHWSASILQHNEELIFDKDLFYRVCREIGCDTSGIDILLSRSVPPQIHEVVQAIDPAYRLNFLNLYVTRHNALLPI